MTFTYVTPTTDRDKVRFLIQDTDSAEDIFITPQPYPSWVRSVSFWNAPIPMPTDGAMYSWNEETSNWVTQLTESSN